MDLFKLFDQTAQSHEPIQITSATLSVLPRLIQLP